LTLRLERCTTHKKVSSDFLHSLRRGFYALAIGMTPSNGHRVQGCLREPYQPRLSPTSTDGTLFHVKTSQNSIPPLMPVLFTQMDRAFYTNLLPLDDQIPYDHLVEQADLHISVTGYPNEDGSSSSVSWTFHSNSFQYSSGSTQAGSCTRYRAVLRGILSVIYVLYRAEQQYPDAPLSTVTLQCSHKKALKEAFRGTPVTLFLMSDISGTYFGRVSKVS
jgi:hypothetical protein